MTEVATVTDDQATGRQMNQASAVTTAGVLLRSAREAQGLPLGALAGILKIPVKKLEALEADRYDLLLDSVFTRALALSVCRALKLDAGPVMAVLPQLLAPAIRTDEVGLNASFKPTGSRFKLGLIVQSLNPAAFVMLALVLAIIVVFLWPAKPAQEEIAEVASPVEQSQFPLVAPTAATAEVAQASAPQLAPASAVATALSEHVPASAPSALASATGVAADAAALASSVAAIVVPESILTLQAQGESWIEVTDAQGKTQLRKTVSAGEVLKVPGVLPLSVVLGRADAVSVAVRGKPFDLAAVSKDNVARFEVK